MAVTQVTSLTHVGTPITLDNSVRRHGPHGICGPEESQNVSVPYPRFWDVSRLWLSLTPPPSTAGHSLQRLPEDPPVQPGHVPLRWLLPERGPSGCGPLTTSQRRHGDQAAQQHVHVPRQPGHEAHLPGLQVSGQVGKDHPSGRTALLSGRELFLHLLSPFCR